MGDGVSTDIYRPLQAPQQQSLGPLQVLQLLGQLQQNKLQQQDLDYRQNIGDAYKKSADPVTGQIDYNKFRQIAPSTGYRAGEAVQQGIQNESSTADLDANYRQKASSIAGTYAGKPDLTDDDIADMKVAMSQKGVPSGFQQTFFAQMPSNARARQKWLVTQSNLARGPEAVATGVTVPGPGGQPVQIPESTAAYARSGGGLQTGMLPGASEALAESQKSLVEDQKASAHTIANVRNLDIALPLIKQLSNPNFGPGSSNWANAKAALIRVGVINPDTDDTTIRQEAGKYLLKYASLAQNSGRSDQALSAALGSNPNLDLTQPANINLIRNQVALDKMDAALPKIFKVEHPNQADAATYNDYKSKYYDSIDRRVFSYNLLSPSERRTLISSLGKPGSPAYKKFENSYELAKKAGVIVPEKQESE